MLLLTRRKIVSNAALKVVVSFGITSLIIFHIMIYLRSIDSTKVQGPIKAKSESVPSLLGSLLRKNGLINYDKTYDIYRSVTDFENFDNVSGAPFGVNIVPNIVHFIRFGEKNMSFIEAVCVLAALKNQRPKKLVIHTDYVNQGGKYWDVVTQHPLAKGVLEVRFLPQPDSIFGHKLNTYWKPWHAADVARLEVLMTEGGIFLDGDSYIVRSLNEFRKFEMTLGWKIDGGIANQIIIAHKYARFLVEWYNNYKGYRPLMWFYNAGKRPTEILTEKPYLIHRLPSLMGEYGSWHMIMIYLKRSIAWTKHYAIHLMINHLHVIRSNLSEIATYPVNFTEDNILYYEASIRDMALAVYPYPHHTVDSN